MKRRQLLKAALAAGAWGLPGVRQLAWASEAAASGANTPLLVLVFLRGGADGLNLIGPAADPDYVAARPPDLRVLESGERAGTLLAQSLHPAAGFRAHVEATPLMPLYRDGKLAVVHAVGLTDGTRSHFVAQDLIERGVADERQMSINTGWLARAMVARGGLLPAYSATAAPVYALRGAATLLAAPDLAGGLGLPFGAASNGLLRALAAAGNSPAHKATAATVAILDGVDRLLPRTGGGKVLPYQPAGGGGYDGAGELGRALAAVARLARLDVGLQVAAVDQGGWDTHEGQPGRFANQVRQLSLGLAAFSEDLAAAGRPLRLVVMSEFGRRLRANKSNGTDHGHGGVMLVLGQGVQGGKMYGRWPGLATPNLAQGVDLAVTTDYRAVLWEVLAASGMAHSGVFPGWQAGPALGLL